MSAAAPQICAPLLKLAPLSLPLRSACSSPKQGGGVLLPALECSAADPFAFSSAILRCSIALFLTWLGTFKVGLLAAGRGPLDPASPALHFVLAVALPIKLTSAGARSPRAAPAVATRSKAEQAESLVSCELKVVVTTAVLLSTAGCSPKLIVAAEIYFLYGAQIYFLVCLMLNLTTIDIFL